MVCTCNKHLLMDLYLHAFNPQSILMNLSQVVTVAWLTATVFFLITYMSPCVPLPPKKQLNYFEESQAAQDQDFYAGISGADSRGLRNFPQLWCDFDLL